MEFTFNINYSSGNKKTGAIPVTRSSRNTCPASCGQRGPCYGLNAPMVWHWEDRTSQPQGEYLRDLHTIPLFRSWRDMCAPAVVRLREVGDYPPLPSDGSVIDFHFAHAEAGILAGRYVIVFTHYEVNYPNLTLADSMSAKYKIHINFSCDTAAQVAALPEGINAVVVTKGLNKVGYIGSRKVVQCPAEYAEYNKVTCSQCGNGHPLCARKRDYLIGFNLHGGRSKYATNYVQF